MTSAATDQKATARLRRRDRVVAAAVLVAIWMLLWGVVSWANLISGLLVAAVVLTVFPLPPVTFSGHLRPPAFLYLAGRFVFDLVVASVQLAVLAFRFGHRPRSAIIRVPLRVPSDLVLTLTGEAISLVPGSLVVDTDQSSTTLYIHVIGVADRAAVEKFRHEVYETEARIVRAIGSDAEIAMLAQRPPAGKGKLT
ncbi:Na+/H+ antiporter subunit E [Paractinoplanes rhizophilus]|jgi:multicomponent Na+:H+ antiporter subunit E|uniref:Na+/H+ antiporter subunit E n=1 Tax=Paractinoplanes rhizophilus TaxID=1416877 RepID=A0ABW2HU89_9ACTN|nr:Na+/H+ antiporter subunit E [Actinoplanes sp.]